MDNKKKNKIKKVVIGVLAAGIIGLGGVLTYQLWPREFVVSLKPTDGSVVVSVSTTLSEKDLRNDYQVVVYNSSNKPHSVIVFNGKTKEVSYSKSHLLDGEKYIFSFERKDRKKIEKLTYKTSMEFTMPQKEIVDDIEDIPFTPTSIKSISTGIPDETNGVWNNIVITMEDQSKEYDYSIGRKTQTNPVFNGIKPGTYTVLVKDRFGNYDSQEYIVNTIQPRGNPLTVQEVQNTIDKVSVGAMSPSDAQEKLANGNVNLSNNITIGDNEQISTLWGVLCEAKWGTKFKVESCKINTSTNKVQSGTLKISKRQ